MAKIIKGERIGKLGKLLIGCSAVVFDSTREKILLTRRSDNGQWCLPGGAMESGESAEEACERELREETGLHIRVIKLIGVYSNPHRLVEYADGNRFHLVGMCFEAEIIGGDLVINEESTDFGYFSPLEMESMDIMEHHRERIADALTSQLAAFIR